MIVNFKAEIDLRDHKNTNSFCANMEQKNAGAASLSGSSQNVNHPQKLYLCTAAEIFSADAAHTCVMLPDNGKMHCGVIKLHFSRLSNLIVGVGGAAQSISTGGSSSRSKLAFTQNVFDEGKRGCLAARLSGGGRRRARSQRRRSNRPPLLNRATFVIMSYVPWRHRTHNMHSLSLPPHFQNINQNN
jgi:hypothetical protein